MNFLFKEVKYINSEFKILFNKIIKLIRLNYKVIIPNPTSSFFNLILTDFDIEIVNKLFYTFV